MTSFGRLRHSSSRHSRANQTINRAHVTGNISVPTNENPEPEEIRLERQSINRADVTGNISVSSNDYPDPPYRPIYTMNSIAIGGPGVTSFRVSDWLHLTKDDEGGGEKVLVSREWVATTKEKLESAEERLVYLEGLVNCMSIDLANLRNRLE